MTQRPKGDVVVGDNDGNNANANHTLLLQPKHRHDCRHPFVPPVPGASARSLNLILILLTITSLICALSLVRFFLLWQLQEQEEQQLDENNTDNSRKNDASLAFRGDGWWEPWKRYLMMMMMTMTQLPQVSMSHCVMLAVVTTLGWLWMISHLHLELRMTETNLPMLRSYLFFLGQAPPLLFHRPWDVFRMWHERYGSVYTFSLFGQLFVSIADPYVLKLVLQSKIHHVRKDVVTAYKPFMDILGTGIVTSEDTAWMQQRVKMSHPLRVDILQKIPTITLQALTRLFQQLDVAIATNNTTIDLAEALRHLTLQVISKAFLSLTADESDRTFANMYLPIVDEGNVRVWHPYRAYCPFLPSFWKFQRHVHTLNTYVSQLIQQRWQERRRREQATPPATHHHQQQQQQQSSSSKLADEDILDQVLAHYEVECRREISSSKLPPPLPSTLPSHVIQQFRDEMKTFMLAGHETSAAMMTWTMIELLVNPTSSFACRVVKEGWDAFPSPTTCSAESQGACDSTATATSTASTTNMPSLEDLSSKLVWTEACLKESLRKYSVVPTLTRRVVQDLHVPEYDYHIPKGTTLILNILTVHHNEQYWPRPMEYNPKRFIPKDIINNNNNSNNSNAEDDNHNDEGDDDDIASADIEPFTFLPFIAGPRNCLGQYLSLLESKIVISMLMSRYQFTLVAAKEQQGCLGMFDTKCWDTEEQDPRHRFMVPVVPKGKVMVRVTKRNTATNASGTS